MPLLVKETRILFLAIRALEQNAITAAVVEAADKLTKSENAAIANRALMLQSQLRKKDV